MRLITGFETPSHKEQLEDLEAFGLEKRKTRNMETGIPRATIWKRGYSALD